MLLAAWLFALTINSVNPTVINSSEEIITIEATASALISPNQYLQVVIAKVGTTDYFGLTKNNADEWYSYKSASSVNDDDLNHFFSFSLTNKSWFGQIQGKIDINNAKYSGPGSYFLKLSRFTSGGSATDSTNSATLEIKVEKPNSPSTPSGTIIVKSNPEIKITFTGEAIVGEKFVAKIEVNNLDKETEYLLKLRGGPDESHITKMQTKNGDSYFSDNESWENFPIIKTDTNGNWSGDIWGLLGEDKDEGIYKIKLRVRKKETDTFSESGSKELKFSKPTVTVTAPIATKSPVVSTPVVLAAETEMATSEPEIIPVIPPAKKSISQKDFSPLTILGLGLIFSAGIMGVFLHKEQLWDIIRRCKIFWPHFS